MNQTIGEKLSTLRHSKQLTQDAVAEYLGVSPQAVSKWENDISCPDIMLLPQIAQLYGITIDDLFANQDDNTVEENVESYDENEYVKEDIKKDSKFSFFKRNKDKTPNINNGDNVQLCVYVNTVTGDDIKVKLPFKLIKAFLSSGVKMSKLVPGTDLSNIDFEQIVLLVESGEVGEILSVKTSNGDDVRIVIEK